MHIQPDGMSLRIISVCFLFSYCHTDVQRWISVLVAVYGAGLLVASREYLSKSPLERSFVSRNSARAATPIQRDFKAKSSLQLYVDTLQITPQLDVVHFCAAWSLLLARQ